MSKFVLSSVKPTEVSLVDKGAILKDFIIYKSKNEKSEFKKGGLKPMKIEEAIELGLIDASQAERIVGKSEGKADASVIKELLSSVLKSLHLKVEKADEAPAVVDKMTDEEKKKMEDEKKKQEEAMNKMKEQVDSLTKAVEGNKKMEELLAKLSSEKDPKEFLKVLNDIKELTKVKPAEEDSNVKVAKLLSEVTKRLEGIELKSKGLNGQESPIKKTSSWGGAFR